MVLRRPVPAEEVQERQVEPQAQEEVQWMVQVMGRSAREWLFSSATGAGGANTGGKSRLGSSVCTSGAETSGDDLGLAGLGAVDSTPNLWS